MVKEDVEKVEKIEIDLSAIPVKPTSRRELQQLETALIIGTLYRPEVIELIKDPVERATWVDSLAVAAAALAREKMGLTVSQIAEEIGRSETMVRAHLQGKTKAGKLVKETYEKLVRGELKLAVPFGGIQLSLEEYNKLKESHERLKELERETQELRKELERMQKALERCVDESKVKQLENIISELEKENASLRGELKKLKEDLEKKDVVLSKIKELLGCK